MRVIAILFFVLSLFFSWGATLEGQVIAVHDGDTITVLDADKKQHKIRLAGIDAPELKQAFGTRARQNLATLVHQQDVRVEWDKTDRYRRTVGKGCARTQGSLLDLTPACISESPDVRLD